MEESVAVSSPATRTVDDEESVSTTLPSTSPSASTSLSPSEPVDEHKEPRVGISQFATISHSFQLVSRQVNLGVDTVGRIAKYLQKLCQAKETYAKEILKATAAENKGLNNGVSDDSMKRFADVWTELKQQVTEEAQQESEFASKTLIEVVNPLLMFSRDLETKRKTLMDHEQKSTQALQAAIQKLLKCKTDCVRILETLSQVESGHPISPTDHHDEAPSSPARKPSGAKSFFSKLKGQVQDLTKSGDKNKTPEELREKAHQAALAYSQALYELNARHQTYYQQELPKIFDEMQKLESSRLDILKQHLGKLSTDNLTRVSPTKQSVIQFIKTVESMETNKDITEYVDHIVHEVGTWVPPDAYTYDLPISPDDILAGKKYTLTTATALAGVVSTPAYRSSITSAGAPTQKSIFGVTIQQAMEMQKEAHPLLDYPIIIPILIQHIRDHQGLNTEGLFRITPNQEHVINLKRQIDAGEEDWKETDIHVYAALLKQWLRELVDPVIPNNYYNQAIEIGKNPNLDGDFSGVRTLYDSLPPINQKILRTVCGLWYDVQANSTVNKMNIVNLSIVVAPCILRNPSNDPVQLMSNTRHESRFVSALIFALAGKDSIEYGGADPNPIEPTTEHDPEGDAAVYRPES